jgi:hypothetical protein
MRTDFSQITFDADHHRYYLNEHELTGVTSKLKTLEKPFDREGNARRVAEREGRSVAAVLAEWDDKAESGRRLGTTVHAHIKQVLLGDGQTTDPFLSLNIKLQEITAFDNFWSQLAPKIDYDLENIECVIGCQELGLAGTVDTVLFSPETNCFHIWDWKTGKFELNNQFANFLPPFDDLEASKFNIYSLQVSAYRLIIERNTNLVMGDSYIVHLSRFGAQVYKSLDLRERLLDWLLS